MTLVRGALLVTIGLAMGAAGGIAVGVQWASELRAQFMRSLAIRPGPYNQRSRDPKQWREDSVLFAKAKARFAGERQPREVRRVQAMNNCAISLEIRDTLWRHLQLFHIGAWDRERPGVTIADAWAYRDGGYEPGDTVTAVLPNVYCGDLDVSTFGAAMVAPATPHQLNVR